MSHAYLRTLARQPTLEYPESSQSSTASKEHQYYDDYTILFDGATFKATFVDPDGKQFPADEMRLGPDGFVLAILKTGAGREIIKETECPNLDFQAFYAAKRSRLTLPQASPSPKAAVMKKPVSGHAASEKNRAYSAAYHKTLKVLKKTPAQARKAGQQAVKALARGAGSS